jgi:hypothetical protein
MRDDFRPTRTKLVETYIKAKEAIIAHGFAAEIRWQDNLRFSRVTETDLLREAAWVVLSSGMRESVIRQKFPKISEAFYLWQSARQIVLNAKKCRARGLSFFHHRQKINAIIHIASQINAMGFEAFKERIIHEGVEFIQTLPFMGPATSFHLAKNMGLDVVKPDRHLSRIAQIFGYSSPAVLCKHISDSVGDRISVVDLVIWRFATLFPDYPRLFAEEDWAVCTT